MTTLSSNIRTFRSSPSTQNRFKLITYIDRVNYFSEAYIKYYKQIFNPIEFIFLVHWDNEKELTEYLKDHGFGDDSIVPNSVRRMKFGFGEQVNKQNNIKKVFLSEGFVVVYADMDELIYHADFKHFILNSKEQKFCAKGYRIIQAPSDSYLDLSKPIFSQRQMAIYDYSKVCVLKTNFTWTPGRHNIDGVPIQDNLFLFDIGRVCKQLTLENNKRNVEIYKAYTPRYGILTMEGLDKEYEQLTRRLVRLPASVAERCPF